ncbi:MAG: hypothetical protein WCV79_00035 [Candidatus Paceibacterota bacterium]
MVNPFDVNFFKFLAGFLCILMASFGVLYVANSYTEPASPAALERSR